MLFRPNTCARAGRLGAHMHISQPKIMPPVTSGAGPKQPGAMPPWNSFCSRCSPGMRPA